MQWEGTVPPREPVPGARAGLRGVESTVVAEQDSRRIGTGFALAVGLCAAAAFHAIVGFAYLVPASSWLGDDWPATTYYQYAVWDEGWYASIAKKGYQAPPDFRLHSNLPFSAGLPLLLRAASLATGLSPDAVRIPVAILSWLVAVVVLSRVLDHAGGERHTRRFALVLFAFAPGSMYFLTSYSESLYLPLLAACFAALLSGRHLLAGVFGAFALSTRSPAVILAPTILVAAWMDHPRTSRRRALLAAALPGLGLAAYMAILWIQVGDPLAFLDGYTPWTRLRHAGLDAWTLEGPSHAVWIGWTQGVPSIWTAGVWFAALPLVVAAERCRMPWIFSVFALFGWLFFLQQAPVITAYEDVLRWTAVLFPFHLGLARLTERPPTLRRGLRLALWSAFAVLWAVNVYRFIHVKWVS